MAELALAGTVIGLEQLGAHLTVKLANFVEAVIDAPASILEVRNELESVNDTLQELKAPVKSQQGHLPESLKRKINRVTEDCTRVFSKLSRLIEKLGTPGGTTQKFRFVFYADNINAARSSLQAQKASLTLILQLALNRTDKLSRSSPRPHLPRNEFSGHGDHPTSATRRERFIEPKEPVPGSATSPDDAAVIPTDDQNLDHGQQMQLNLSPKPLRRFDTDEPEKVTEDGIALVLAADRDDLEMVKLLLEFEVSPNAIGEDSQTPLQAAAFRGWIPVLKHLIEKGARVSQLGPAYGSPLYAAIKIGRLDAVKILLEAKADPDGDAVLVTAADRGDVGCVKVLLNAGANVDIRGGEPLQVVAFSGRLEVVKVLLEAGANAEATGPPWGSALRAAVSTGKKDVARVLMEHKKRLK